MKKNLYEDLIDRQKDNTSYILSEKYLVFEVMDSDSFAIQEKSIVKVVFF